MVDTMAVKKTRRNSFTRSGVFRVLFVVMPLGAAGCISNKLVADTSFTVGRAGAAGVETVQDFEAGEKMAYSGLAQLESLHVLSPRNVDGLYLLVRAWTGVGQGFIMDEYEQALEKGDEAAANYARLRARAAFERAKQFGIQLLGIRAEGFVGATRNANTLQTWLMANFDDKKYAPELLWLGAAWLGRIGADSENSATIADLWIGVELIEHVARLDETIEHGLAHVILGAYHARAVIGELDEAKQHFDRALQINGGKYLVTQLQMAERYYCLKHDKAGYDKALAEVLDTPDPLPEARLANTVAKRFARRYVGNKLWQEECGFGL
jgi:tetratricopeptide (TPR) repeat protein